MNIADLIINTSDSEDEVGDVEDEVDPILLDDEVDDTANELINAGNSL